MLFKDHLRKLRIAENLTQGELAKRAGMSEKAVQNYELGPRMPRIMKASGKLAALGTTAEELLGNSGMLIVSAHERGGAKAAREVHSIVRDVSGQFANGELSEEDKEAVMMALNDIYWESKERNKKYTPKKYRRQEAVTGGTAPLTGD